MRRSCATLSYYIEKQFCALVLATLNLEDRTAHKEASIKVFPEAARKVPLAWLIGLMDLLHPYVLGVLLLGNLVRDCNRGGQLAGMGRTARKVPELSFALIVALPMDTDCNVPYMRTLCVALLLWLLRMTPSWVVVSPRRHWRAC